MLCIYTLSVICLLKLDILQSEYEVQGYSFGSTLMTAESNGQRNVIRSNA
jgi:hypothetical protein